MHTLFFIGKNQQRCITHDGNMVNTCGKTIANDEGEKLLRNDENNNEDANEERASVNLQFPPSHLGKD